jgi:MFS transporter, YNFM family, putative membrane transport protein
MAQVDRAVSRASSPDDATPRSSFGAPARSLLIGHIAFLTVVDLFATQAILPILTHVYKVAPAAMGLAVNASTLGMAVASIAVAVFNQKVDRRRGIIISLAFLAIPTFLLAFAPNLAVFAGLRIAQGLCMASAFTLTLAYLGERCSAQDTAGAFASYVTGNVASNLFGRLLSAAVADHFGLTSNFFVFAGLNITVRSSSTLRSTVCLRWRLRMDKPDLRHMCLPCICAIAACAPPSRSASAFSSPSSGFSLTSTSSSSVRQSRST